MGQFLCRYSASLSTNSRGVSCVYTLCRNSTVSPYFATFSQRLFLSIPLHRDGGETWRVLLSWSQFSAFVHPSMFLLFDYLSKWSFKYWLYGAPLVKHYSFRVVAANFSPINNLIIIGINSSIVAVSIWLLIFEILIKTWKIRTIWPPEEFNTLCAGRGTRSLNAIRFMTYSRRAFFRSERPWPIFWNYYAIVLRYHCVNLFSNYRCSNIMAFETDRYRVIITFP